MPCYTSVRVSLDDTALNRKARKNLGLAVEGSLDSYEAQRVKQEVGVLKAIAETRRLSPTAVIKRKGNKLSVQVEV
jgi:hypothetical protein